MSWNRKANSFFVFSPFLPADDSSSEDGNDEDDDEDGVRHVRRHLHHNRHDTDDEGIEKDHDLEDSYEFHSQQQQQRRPEQRPRQQQHQQPAESRGSSADRVLSLCSHHLSVKSEADSHFRAVCRALVTESIELATFLEKTRKAKEVREHEDLQELALQDWAHLWIQTMQELRQGVKLKKTNYTKTPIEYELTPYEMLMDDIRSRRYKLNKVAVDGKIPPRVKRDAHDIILEFIRSRPPLKPVSKRTNEHNNPISLFCSWKETGGDIFPLLYDPGRLYDCNPVLVPVLKVILPPLVLNSSPSSQVSRRKLAPARRYSTPQELLMQSIRSSSARDSLRKTERPPSPRLSPAVLNPEFRSDDEEDEDKSARAKNTRREAGRRRIPGRISGMNAASYGGILISDTAPAIRLPLINGSHLTLT